MQFGNDKSRIIRGLAIILMVTGHSCPGKIIPFAVPLFSFLVGYGYEFARTRNLRHAAKRIWHLLSHFWFILLGICVPIAVFYTHARIPVHKVIMNMFGLWGGLNYFCWYVNFYILAMLTMPFLSKIIDRYNWRGLAGLLILFGVIYGAYYFFPELTKIEVVKRFERYFKYMPVVLGGYWMAHYKVFSFIKLKAGSVMIWLSLVAIIAFYLLRGVPYAKVADFIITPLFAGAVALFFESAETLSAAGAKLFGYIKIALTDLGIKSMHIWFLHAIFFTAVTKKMFRFMDPLMKEDVPRVITVLAASWLLAVCTMKLYSFLSSSSGKLRNLPARMRRIKAEDLNSVPNEYVSEK